MHNRSRSPIKTVLRNRAKAFLLVLAWVSSVAALAQEAGVITLHYNPRVPYEYVEDGVVKGLVAAPIERAFKKAGVAFQWSSTPIARQFYMVQSNVGLDCLSGRFKNDDRAKWARFSKPVYRDQPQGLLVGSNNEKMKAFASIESAIRATDVALLVKSGNSYGAVLDGFIRQRTTPKSVTFDESPSMLRQLKLGIVDTFIIAPEEADALVAQAGFTAKEFSFLGFPDAPAGELRYIMCSQRVPESVMERLNAAIVFKER